MLIFNYDRNTFEFISQSEAELDPLDKNPLIPSFSTAVEVPALGINEVALFDEITKLWVIKSDYRDSDYWDTANALKIEFRIGDKPLSTMTEIVPTQQFPIWSVDKWVEDDYRVLTELSSSIKEAIQEKLDSIALTFGFDNINSTAKFIGYTNRYETDALALATLSANWWGYSEDEELKVIDGTRTLPTPSEMLAELETAFPSPTKV